MAKIVKDTRETIDVNLELENIKSKVKTTEKKKTDKRNQTTNKNAKKKKTTNKKKSGKGIFNFFKEVKNEVSKVKWPSKKDMGKYSVATIVFVIFFALFFYLIDLIIVLLKAGV